MFYCLIFARVEMITKRTTSHKNNIGVIHRAVANMLDGSNPIVSLTRLL